jgi:hypothetical protein
MAESGALPMRSGSGLDMSSHSVTRAFFGFLPQTLDFVFTKSPERSFTESHHHGRVTTTHLANLHLLSSPLHHSAILPPPSSFSWQQLSRRHQQPPEASLPSVSTGHPKLLSTCQYTNKTATSHNFTTHAQYPLSTSTKTALIVSIREHQNLNQLHYSLPASSTPPGTSNEPPSQQCLPYLLPLLLLSSASQPSRYTTTGSRPNIRSSSVQSTTSST